MSTIAVVRREMKWSVPVLVALVIVSASPTQAKYGGGSGTADDPYLIHTAEQMNTIGLHSEDWDKHFKLMADLDLAAYQGDSFHVIGRFRWQGEDNHAFSGVFDGNGHMLSNFTYVVNVSRPGPVADDGFQYPAMSAVGLFRFVWQCEIRNLGLIGPDVGPSADSRYPLTRVGALVGMVLGDSRIFNCYVEGGRVRGVADVGGMVGLCQSGALSGCYATCAVSYYSGAYVPPEKKRYNGPVFPESFGGLVGVAVAAERDVTICDSYAAGTVSGSRHVGGLVGFAIDDRSSGESEETGFRIDRCYASGKVAGDQAVGGLVGEVAGRRRSRLYVFNSFWDKQVTGQNTSAGGGNGETTAGMQRSETYARAGWDFAGENTNGTKDTWRIHSGRPAYPRLTWQKDVVRDLNGSQNAEMSEQNE